MRDWIVPLIFVLIVLVFFLGVYSSQESTRCPEDSFKVWSGETNDHTICLALDDWLTSEQLDILP